MQAADTVSTAQLGPEVKRLGVVCYLARVSGIPILNIIIVIFATFKKELSTASSSSRGA